MGQLLIIFYTFMEKHFSGSIIADDSKIDSLYNMSTGTPA